MTNKRVQNIKYVIPNKYAFLILVCEIKTSSVKFTVIFGYVIFFVLFCPLS